MSQLPSPDEQGPASVAALVGQSLALATQVPDAGLPLDMQATFKSIASAAHVEHDATH
jgi:hypothetical protein